MTIAGMELNGATFKLFTPDEVRRISVMEVVTPNSYDALDHPLKGGLYDLTLGTGGSRSDTCLTCRQSDRFCPGHFGHIELPVPVINPLFKKEVFSLLKSSCQNCYKVTVPVRYKYLLIYQLKILNAGYVTESQELAYLIKSEDDVEDLGGILIKQRITDYLNERGFNLNKDVVWTKTMESLRREFIDSYLKHLDGIYVCQYCKKKLQKMVLYRDQILTAGGKVTPSAKYTDGGEGSTSSGPTVILPSKARLIIKEVWQLESELIKEVLPILKNIEVPEPTDLLFMNAVLVTPPKTRPVNFSDSKKALEHPQTRIYKEILKSCIIINNLVMFLKNKEEGEVSDEFKNYLNTLQGKNVSEKMINCCRDLQMNVDNLLSPAANVKRGASGLKSLLEKKEGLLRKHMMGKRVNYAARSVITPDPNLLIQEIGIPEYFAKKLTYPVKVNFFNVQELRRMVRNGPDVYPGATIVESENGSMVRLLPGKENRTKRDGIAKLLLKSVESGGGKIVHRHLINGDVLLLNRQPTLHRPSIMAHKARVLKGEKTLRMHYSNCKSYNADFDGDEMNAHLPQSEVARSEAYNLVGVRNNYLVPKDGTPLGGLIQDHVISGVRLTLRGQFFNRKDYYQLVYQGLGHTRGDIKLLPPTILKPQMLWSGKQIISTILINIIPKNKDLITLHAQAKIRHKAWQTEPKHPWKCGEEFGDEGEMSESNVIIHKGELLCGVLDKQHYGATPYGLTHCLYELYGGKCSSSFLDSAGKLFTSYLQWDGFTLGIEDIIIDKRHDKKRSKIVENVRLVGGVAASKALDLEDVPPDLEERLEKAYFTGGAAFKARLDQEYKKVLDSYTNDINNVCLPKGLITRFPKNNLQLMVTSGAKGSTVNTMQISCLLGQIELEGKRPPWMISGKSLPSFKPFETSPSAGGYIDARFMTGITPQDFFFHCMAGREGLVDTAVKTARSGYLQRCLIKLLEGVIVNYDGTVRDHDGSVIQFAYGEDGLEVQKSTFLHPDRMDFLYQNQKSIVDKSSLQLLKDSTDVGAIEEYKKKIKSWDEEVKGWNWKLKPFTQFSLAVRDNIADKHWKKFRSSSGRPKGVSKVLKKWNALDDEEKKSYEFIRPDPVASKYNRNCDFGAITERLEKLIVDYMAVGSTFSKSEKTVRNIVNMKYMSSLCQPGEAVGLLAAQSIGEPSTQMTLNTFHFAGRGEMNVTLGIPRLREILMTASKAIKTPYMDIPVKGKTPKKREKRGRKMKKLFQRVTLSDVLEKIEVNEKLVTSPEIQITYRTKFFFLPQRSYSREFNTNPKDIMLFMEFDFLMALSRIFRKLAKRTGDQIREFKDGKTNNDSELDNVEDCQDDSRSFRVRKDSSSSDDGGDEDDDATAVKMRQRRTEEQEYDDPDEDELEESEDEDEELEKRPEGEESSRPKEDEPSDSGLVNDSRKQSIMSKFDFVRNVEFDQEGEWCVMTFGLPVTMSHIDFSTILKDICENGVIYQVPNVKRSILYENRAGVLSLKTEGINLNELFMHAQNLDLRKLYTNDIHEMARVYGIEAASRIIVNELKEVFGVYGITVDPRHLLLIADFMTHQGIFSPFNRIGMACNPSPFQQMSFESTISFLKTALDWGKTDSLTSPSARIMTGKYCMSGTGCFDLVNERLCSVPRKSQAKEIPACSGDGL